MSLWSGVVGVVRVYSESGVVVVGEVDGVGGLKCLDAAPRTKPRCKVTIAVTPEARAASEGQALRWL
jgi:hypothetical protein